MITKVNNKLLTLFLSLGILIFIAFIYLFIQNEVIDKKSKSHSVSLKSFKVVKNLHALNFSSDSFVNDRNNLCSFCLIYTKDSLVYVRSDNFSLNQSEAPFSLHFSSDNEHIPSETLGDNYKLVLIRNKTTIYEFDLKTLNELLSLENKTNEFTVERSIKLESPDKKLAFYLLFSIDSSTDYDYN